jgi:hypothetical protein
LWPEEARRRWTAPLFAGLLTMTLLGAYGVLNPTSTRVPVPDAPVAIFGDNQIALLSTDTSGVPGPDGQVTLLTRWQALRPIDQDYTVFFHAVGPDGSRWSLARSSKTHIRSFWRQMRRSAATIGTCWGCISGRQASVSPPRRTIRSY